MSEGTETTRARVSTGWLAPRAWATGIVGVGLGSYFLMMPWSGSAANVARDVSVAALLLGLTLSLVVDGSDRRARGALPLLAFAATFPLAAVFSPEPAVSLRASAHVAFGLLFFFAVQRTLISPRGCRAAAWIVACVIAVFAADYVAQAALGRSALSGRTPRDGRMTSGLPNPNDVAFLVLLAPFAGLVLQGCSTIVARVASMALVPLLVTALALTQSRNAWLGALVVGAALLVSAGRRLAMGLALAAAAACFGVACVVDPDGVGQRLQSVLHPDLSREGRVGVWWIAVRMGIEAPIIGQGPGAFGRQYLPLLLDTQWPEWYRPEYVYIPWAHNIYLEAVAERGIIGLVVMVAFGWLLLRRLRRPCEALPPTADAVRRAAIASVWACAVMGLFDLTFLKDWVWIYCGSIAALIAQVPRLAEVERSTLATCVDASHSEKRRASVSVTASGRRRRRWP